MRIAVWHNLPSGGGKRALFYHVRGLIERGHYVEAWCPPSADQEYLPLGKLINEHIEPLKWRETVSGRRNLMRRLRAMEEHCLRCAEQINGGSFDLLFANSCMWFACTPIARYVQGPSVLYLQEPYRWLYEALPRPRWAAITPECGEGPYSPRFLRRWVGDWLNVNALRIQMLKEVESASAFTRILVNSLYSRESVYRAYGLDSRPCYLGVDTEQFVNLKRARRPIVIGLGAFYRTKNVDFVIRALGHVRPQWRHLIWIGNASDESYVEELRRLATELGVTFEPKIRAGDREIVEMLNCASVMAYAPRLEPFGFAPLEANACGLPVVGVAEGGVRETVVHGVNGLVCDANPSAMAEAVERLMGDEPYARELGARGEEIVRERWSLSAAVDRLESALLSIVSRSGASPA